GATVNLVRTVATGNMGGALSTSANMAKAGATAEMAGQAADKADPSGTMRKVAETAGGIAMASPKAPKPPPRVKKPDALKDGGARAGAKLLNAVPNGIKGAAEHIFGKNLAKHNMEGVLSHFGGDAVNAT